MTARTFVMAGGGTGGHVIPALAVATELKRRGHKTIFIGTRKGLESKLVPEAGFRLEWIEMLGDRGGGFRMSGMKHRLIFCTREQNIRIHGFTLIELVMVLLVVAALLAIR